MAVRARITILLGLLLLAFAAALYFLPKRVSSPVANSLDQLRTNQWNREEKESAATALARLGDAAIPYLASALKDKDTDFNKKYDLWRAKLPLEIQKQLPARPSKDDLRRAIATSIYDIGPAACRAVVGGIEHGLDPSRGFENTLVLRALYWSIPESPKAVQILSNYLAHPGPGLPLFGMKDAAEIWPTVPNLAPLLAT
jgi:hypothetical protein